MSIGSEIGSNASENTHSGTTGAERPTNGTPTSTEASPTVTKRIGRKLHHISDILENVLKEIYSRGAKPKYPTGLTELDDLLWGLHKKELMIIGARTSHGKSSLALQFAIELATQSCKVGYFSLEMSKEQMVERIIAYLCPINNRSLRHGIATSQLKAKEGYLRTYLPTLKLLIDDEGGYTFDSIVEVCEHLNFDFIIVDYIQMISARGFKSKLDAIDEYVRKFKELCKLKNFGGIMVSQINRSGVDDMGLEHLKGSGTLEEHPDTVLLLNWNKEDDEYEVRVEKQRHGERGIIKLDYAPEYFKFKSYVPKTERVNKKRSDIYDA